MDLGGVGRRSVFRGFLFTHQRAVGDEAEGTNQDKKPGQQNTDRLARAVVPLAEDEADDEAEKHEHRHVDSPTDEFEISHVGMPQFVEDELDEPEHAANECHEVIECQAARAIWDRDKLPQGSAPEADDEPPHEVRQERSPSEVDILRVDVEASHRPVLAGNFVDRFTRRRTHAEDSRKDAGQHHQPEPLAHVEAAVAIAFLGDFTLLEETRAAAHGYSNHGENERRKHDEPAGLLEISHQSAIQNLWHDRAKNG